MSGLGSIIALASQAAQPLASQAATCVDLPTGSSYADVSAAEAGDAGAAGVAAAPGPASGDYGMAVLAKITHAGAEQALTLIEGLSVTFGK